MFVYIRSEPGLWTVGHYDPSGKWVAESDHTTTDAAARRVAELNGAAAPTEAARSGVPWRWNKPAAKVMAAFLESVAQSAGGSHPNPDDYQAIAAGLMFSLAVLRHREMGDHNSFQCLHDAARRCLAMVPPPPKDDE